MVTDLTMRAARCAAPFCVLLLVGLASPVGSAVAGDTSGSSTVSDSEWMLATVGAHRAWQVSRGAGVTVAVLDSGVDASHPDLRGRVRGGGDFGDGSTGNGLHDAAPADGHGTEVASVVAATGRNYRGNGLTGLAPEAHVLSLGVYRNGHVDPSAVQEATRAAIARGASVLLVPAAGLTSGALRTARRGDAVVVTEAVSHGPRAADLRGDPGAVAAVPVDRFGVAAAAATPDHGAAIAAPGTEILAASATGSYWTGDDAAFAAAAVAGAAALLRSAQPGLGAGQVVGRLVDSAQTAPSRCGGSCGAGLLRADRALVAAPAALGGHHARPDRNWGVVIAAAVVLLVALAASTGWWLARMRRVRGPEEGRT